MRSTNVHIAHRLSLDPMMNRYNVQNALHRLSDRNTAREEEIQRHSSRRSAKSDDEADSECPIMEYFYSERGNTAIKTMANMTSAELRLYGKFHGSIVNHWNIGRKKVQL